ncbi:hypothetical protein PAXRUDRAFT_165439 [Paxillus rubicundulus Ve08.2h10]|uniref:Uncharacterized protein n=1 Tax=Paxillus rubicundulus Ve08.2h10 TaxID=930991 RepID=A0A0D0D302_9AGAM|nr:hypothetical protein PAXRUDRAFT_165439 [Paxillus rubicundulus Ve08.2h10]
MAAQRRADAMHDPGGGTRAQGCKPPSVGLEGESNQASSPCVEIEADVCSLDDNSRDESTEPPEPAGTLHKPQNGMDSSGSQPPSVWLEGEKCRPLSRHIEPNNVKTVEGGTRARQQEYADG